ncbi:hypothetical protein PUN28_015675 [Cardiocondyla obscurior]|uniref:Uncharacterized protein n=1 Tax=Cardiocondyla obscurior TaxID=286306 RepID=A0AAW2EVD9_9HYME
MINLKEIDRYISMYIKYIFPHLRSEKNFLKKPAACRLFSISIVSATRHYSRSDTTRKESLPVLRKAIGRFLHHYSLFSTDPSNERNCFSAMLRALLREMGPPRPLSRLDRSALIVRTAPRVASRAVLASDHFRQSLFAATSRVVH